MPSKTTTEYQCDRCGKAQRTEPLQEPLGWVHVHRIPNTYIPLYLCPECFKRAMEPYEPKIVIKESQGAGSPYDSLATTHAMLTGHPSET